MAWDAAGSVAIAGAAGGGIELARDARECVGSSDVQAEQGPRRARGGRGTGGEGHPFVVVLLAKSLFANVPEGARGARGGSRPWTGF
jgi:hypothetical protein